MRTKWFGMAAVMSIALLVFVLASAQPAPVSSATVQALAAGGGLSFDQVIDANSQQLLAQGRKTFRFDTFGDETYWGDTLQLHKAIEGSANGGVGPGVSPSTALAVGLKVDVDALPQNLVQQLKTGKVNLNDPATTLALLKLNAVVG